MDSCHNQSHYLKLRCGHTAYLTSSNAHSTPPLHLLSRPGSNQPLFTHMSLVPTGTIATAQRRPSQASQQTPSECFPLTPSLWSRAFSLHQWCRSLVYQLSPDFPHLCSGLLLLSFLRILCLRFPTTKVHAVKLYQTLFTYFLLLVSDPTSSLETVYTLRECYISSGRPNNLTLLSRTRQLNYDR